MSPARQNPPGKHHELIERLLALKDGEWLPIEVEEAELRKIRVAVYHGLAIRGYRLEIRKDAKNKRIRYFRASKIRHARSGAKEEPPCDET